MSHIHIPDGVLPTWLWVLGWAAALALVGVAVHMSRAEDLRRKVPLVGVVSAFVVVAMSSEIVPIAYHMNLAVVAGVLLGPWLGIVAALIVQVILAAIGHGGVTVIGLNTLMTSTEMVLGGLLFNLFVLLLGRRRAALSGAFATVLTLALTTSLLVGLVALAGGGVATSRETGALDPKTLSFSNPFTEGVFSVNTLTREVPPSTRASETPRSSAHASK